MDRLIGIWFFNLYNELSERRWQLVKTQRDTALSLADVDGRMDRVRVAETHLSGTAAFLRVPEIHTWIANHPESIEATLSFLKTGRFAAPEGGNMPTERTPKTIPLVSDLEN